jgi:ABC-type phosphate transport system auxiliary subunit
MHDSVIETLDYYRRQANSCYGRDAYKKIDEIISVLAEEVPLVKSKKYIVAKPYNRSYDEEYKDQLRYLGKMIDLKIAELTGIEKRKSQKINELSSQLTMVTEEKNALEGKYSRLYSEYSALEDKYNKALRELKDNSGNK